MKTEINLHLRDFYAADFTLEYNVKKYSYSPATRELCEKFNDEEMFQLQEIVRETLAKECFEELQKKIKSKKVQIINKGFAGRSGGWYVLCCTGVTPYPNSPICEQIKSIVEKYYKKFEKRLVEYINLNS